MTLLSSTTAYHGLEGANLTEKAQCTGEKMVNNLKGNATVIGIGVGSGATFALAKKYKPVADAFERVFDKGANALKKSGVIEKVKQVGTKAIEYCKQNPKLAKTAAIISGIALLGTNIAIIKNTYQNGKIEGKYQTIADAKK